jgi:lactate dehydrogenase-like 2-hydroxyacid dehydrogenase
LGQFSQKPLIVCDQLDPAGPSKAAWRSTDALIVGLRVVVDRHLMAAMKNLRYLGVYGTSTHLIDRASASERDIKITSVASYCEEETAEFCLAALENALAAHARKSAAPPVLGIVGMGKIGTQVARLARVKGMQVLYHDTRSEIEVVGCLRCKTLPELLANAEILSLHVSRDSMVMGQDEFAKLKRARILLNTCLGKVVDSSALAAWLKEAGNTVIMDALAAHDYPQIRTFANAVVIDRPAWVAQSSLKKLSENVIKNLAQFLEDQAV